MIWQSRRIWKNRNIVFAPGEKCTELVLWGNGDGRRTCRIKIVTDKGQTLDWGKDTTGQTAYPSNLGSGILVGFMGRYGADIDCMAPLFLKDVKSVTSKVTYGKIPTGKDGIQLVELDTLEVDN